VALAMLAGCGTSTPAHAAQPYPATGLVLLSLSDGSARASASIGTDPVAVIVSDDGATAYVADSSPGDVYAVQLADLKVAWKQHVGGAPFGLLLHGGSLFVSLFSSGAVVELDPATGVQRARHALPQGPAVMSVDATGRVVVAGTRGQVYYLDGTAIPAGNGFGIAVVNGVVWTADYERAELVREGDGHRVGLPLPVFPFWLSAGPNGTMLIAAEGASEDTDQGGVFSFDTRTSKFATLARPRDPDQVLQAGSKVLVASHGDREVLAIEGRATSTWAPGAAAVAIAADPMLNMLVVVVNAHE
jgi:DNA-binding beta-propeller fold protein YncE